MDLSVGLLLMITNALTGGITRKESPLPAKANKTNVFQNNLLIMVNRLKQAFIILF